MCTNGPKDAKLFNNFWSAFVHSLKILIIFQKATKGSIFIIVLYSLYPSKYARWDVSGRGDCSNCHMSFAQSSTLKTHMAAVHLGKKHYSCSQCEKSFFRSSHLKSHIAAVHRGEKNYPCSHCDKFFADSSNLNKHVSIVHRGRSTTPAPCVWRNHLFKLLT